MALRSARRSTVLAVALVWAVGAYTLAQQPTFRSTVELILADMNVGSTMQLLGTLNGVRFYAVRNADGHFCLAIDRVDAQYEKGFGCDLNADGFPSARVQALT